MRLQEIKEVMMEQTVTVVGIVGHDALVRGRRVSACGQCPGKSSCGTLGSWVERYSEIRVANPLGARAGDEVIVSVPDGVLMRAAIRLYGMPMLGFFTMGFLVRYLAFFFGVASPEVWAAGGALAGMIAVLVWVRRTSDAQEASGARIIHIKCRAAGVPVHVAGSH